MIGHHFTLHSPIELGLWYMRREVYLFPVATNPILSVLFLSCSGEWHLRFPLCSHDTKFKTSAFCFYIFWSLRPLPLPVMQKPTITNQSLYSIHPAQNKKICFFGQIIHLTEQHRSLLFEFCLQKREEKNKTISHYISNQSDSSCPCSPPSLKNPGVGYVDKSCTQVYMWTLLSKGEGGDIVFP